MEEQNIRYVFCVRTVPLTNSPSLTIKFQFYHVEARPQDLPDLREELSGYEFSYQIERLLRGRLVDEASFGVRKARFMESDEVLEVRMTLASFDLPESVRRRIARDVFTEVVMTEDRERGEGEPDRRKIVVSIAAIGSGLSYSAELARERRSQWRLPPVVGS